MVIGRVTLCGPALEEHRAAVRRTCRRLVRCPARAEELTQDTLLVALVRWDELRSVDLVRAWLIGIARNLCRNERRRQANEFRKVGRLAFETAPHPPDALERLIADQRDALVRAGITAVLDEACRTVLRLKYEEERTDRDISKALDLAGTGARGVLQTCRRRLRGTPAFRRDDF